MKSGWFSSSQPTQWCKWLEQKPSFTLSKASTRFIRLFPQPLSHLSWLFIIFLLSFTRYRIQQIIPSSVCWLTEFPVLVKQHHHEAKPDFVCHKGKWNELNAWKQIWGLVFIKLFLRSAWYHNWSTFLIHLFFIHLTHQVNNSCEKCLNMWTTQSFRLLHWCLRGGALFTYW